MFVYLERVYLVNLQFFKKNLQSTIKPALRTSAFATFLRFSGFDFAQPPSLRNAYGGAIIGAKSSVLLQEEESTKH